MIMPIIARIELIIIYKYEIVALSERKRDTCGKRRLLLVSKNVLPRMMRRKFLLHNVI